ncbi:glycoside hydrolase family 3 protein [Candidatus Margulisiibacteriota bacterium]
MLKKVLLFILVIICAANAAFAADPGIEVKVGQMIMVGFTGTNIGSKTLAPLRTQIKNGDISGVVLLSKNIMNKTQTKKLTSGLKKLDSPYPLLIGVDQEGGNVARLKKSNGFRYFPSAKKVANTRTPNESYYLYLKMAKMLKGAGFNLNFAPVVDLNINPRSPAIGKYWRSYSANPEKVTKYAEKLIKAHRKVGLLTSLKHYPGHGSALQDSHFEVADVTRTWKKEELLPYEKLINMGLVDMIISAHIFNANIDPKYPASLSRVHIQENLRDKLGYDGVVVTDDLQMKAISEKYPVEEVIVTAVNSGSDILFFIDPVELPPRKVKNIILQAIENGKIKKERIDESFNRIIKLKNNLKTTT